tara:strand:- start:12979 stop:14058 length:1080 start_codon:yes stop_codon:yes gene_type:complete
MSDVKATKTQLDKLSKDPEVQRFIAIKQKSDVKHTHADRKLKMEVEELITKAREIAKRKGMDDTLARMTALETQLNIGYIKPREMRHLKQRLRRAVAKQDVADAVKAPEEMDPLTESLNVTDNVGFLSDGVKPLFDSFVQFSQKNIGFNRPPTINFMHDEQNAGNVLGKTAYYQPDMEAITVFTTGRHPKDVLRSLSHEMVHHFQNCEGRLQNITTGEGYTQKNSNMRELEREAYESGNMNFRDWEDNYKSTIKEQKGENKMSLREWMNQERGILLREKFGLPLQEEVDNKVDFKEKATAESDGTDMVAEDEELDETCALPQEPEELEDDDDHDTVYETKTRTLVAELIDKALQKIQSE